MKKLLFITTLLIALASQGQVQNPAKREKIKNLFASMHQDSLIIKTLDGVASSMAKNMSKMFNDTMYTNHGVDVSKISQKLMERSMKKSKEYALRLVNEDMVDIYDKYFTAEDIDAFAAFYQSRAGQKLLSRTPDISKDLMEIMGAKYQKDLQQSFTKDFEEIMKEVTEQINTQKI